MPLNWTLKNGQKGKFYNKCGGGLVTKSCLTLATPWTIAHQAPLSMGFPRQEYWSGTHTLLQGIFLTQGSNLGLLHCRQILYRLSRQGSPLQVPADAAQLLQSCPTLCDPIDGSPPGAPIPGIFQARILEWVAISFSRGSS